MGSSSRQLSPERVALRQRTSEADKPGMHRTTPDTEKGRSMIGARGSLVVDPKHTTLTPEQIEWNRQVEAKRKRKTA